MIIMGVNLSHDGSVCVLDKGKVVFYQEEERVTHEKHTTGVIHSFVAGMKFNPTHVVFTSATPYEIKVKDLFASLMGAHGKLNHFEDYVMPEIHFMRDHHLAHAAAAFYNSGFDEASVLVVDGAGQAFIDDEYLYRETETIFSAKYNNFDVKLKKVIKQHTLLNYQQLSGELADKTYLSPCASPLPTEYEVKVHDADMSIGKMFSKAGIDIFGDYHQAGKVMGLSAYGVDQKEDPRAFIEDDANPGIFTHGMSNEDLAFRIQNDSLIPIVNLVREALDNSKHDNVCLSGGYFLNCVNNYKLLKLFPHANFYIEPNSSDAGTALGAAKYWWHTLSGDHDIRELETLYLSGPADHRFDSRDIRDIVQASPKDVAKLLSERNVVAIYQGKAEAGPRALGNRSILYDPRDRDARDVLNMIKKRESFRPFGGTVLEEKASQWFDMYTLKSSPYMLYAVDSQDGTAALIPGLMHNDGTSRIQTINESQNPNYHALISEFDSLTGVPMILNTSFNLAGDTLVQTMDDAIRTCLQSGIPYLYCPEIESIITF
jgi:carbamoyltransferase